MTLKSIAKIWGVSRSRAQQIIRRKLYSVRRQESPGRGYTPHYVFCPSDYEAWLDGLTKVNHSKQHKSVRYIYR